MTTDIERKAVYDLMFSRPEYLTTGLAVVESWPNVRDDVCEKFLNRLCSQIETEAGEKLKEFADDIWIRPKYFRQDERDRSSIWLYRGCWIRNEVEQPDSNRRTCIQLRADEKGRPDGWYMCVTSPMFVAKVANGDMRGRSLDIELEKELGPSKRKVDGWPWWDWVDKDKRNWNSLVPLLQKENEGDGSEVTRYFVDTFIDIAKKAIPVINQIEGEGTL